MKPLRRNLLFLKAVLTRKVPLYVQYAVTKRCNLSCRMCQTTAARSRESELGLGEIDRLAEVVSRIGAGFVILTGGEPMLRKDLAEVVGIFARRGLSVRLQTNAVLSDPGRLRELMAAGLEEVTISLHSLRPEVNDRITGVEGSWEKIIRGLANWIAVLPEWGSLSGINVTVSRHNLEELPALVSFISGIGFYASIIPVHLAGPGSSRFIVRADDGEGAFTPADRETVERVYDRLVAMKRSGFRIYNSYRFLRESREFLLTGRVSWRCLSPDLYYSISPQGHFLPCVDIGTDISMLDDDFLERYRSGEIPGRIRKIARACSGCMYACYPEMVYLCHDPGTFFERAVFAFRAGRARRERRDYRELIAAAGRLRQ
jgi:MoaA/NifB/PqqE/SkfB family radical SAM enzyme